MCKQNNKKTQKMKSLLIMLGWKQMRISLVGWLLIISVEVAGKPRDEGENESGTQRMVGGGISSHSID